jgi:hypothetical protein
MKFSTPVWILDGRVNFRSVGSAEEAYAYLRGWRGPRAAIYDHALAILGGALNGQVGSIRAREIFRQFASSENVLAEADVAEEPVKP